MCDVIFRFGQVADGVGFQVQDMCEVHCVGRYILTDSRGLQLEADLDSDSLLNRTFGCFSEERQ